MGFGSPRRRRSRGMLADVVSERDRLRAFAREVFEAADWPEGADLDGGTLQDLAVKHGILTPETQYAPCGEACMCRDYYAEDEFPSGITCIRKPKWMLDGEESDGTIQA